MFINIILKNYIKKSRPEDQQKKLKYSFKNAFDTYLECLISVIIHQNQQRFPVVLSYHWPLLTALLRW